MILMLVAIIATIVACCIMRCRIPRTKQEIEADVIRKKITKQFRAHLNKISIEGMELIGGKKSNNLQVLRFIFYLFPFSLVVFSAQ